VATARPATRRAADSAPLLLILSAASFGLTWVAAPWATDEIPPLVVACVRFAIAAVLLFGWCRWRGIPIPLRRADLPVVIGVTATSVVTYNLLFLYGVTLAPASHGAVIVPGLIPIFTLILSRLVFGERVAGPRIAGALVALVGLALVVGPAFGGGREIAGDLMFAAGAGAWATYAIFSRLATQRMHAAAITLLSSAFGSGIFAILTVVLQPGGFGALATAAPQALAGVIYLGTFGTVFSFVLFALGVEMIGPARASAYAVLIPLFGVAATVTILGEPAEPVALVGAAIVIVGLRLMQSGSSGSASAAPASASAAEAGR
jgi:drug/metabolite transporter (DMT)-like permease